MLWIMDSYFRLKQQLKHVNDGFVSSNKHIFTSQDVN